MENIKPIDRGKQTHKIIKSSLKNVLNNYEDFIPIIENTVLRTNKIIIYGYQFLRAFIIEKYNNNIKIDRQFIYNILKTVSNNEKIKFDTNDKYKDIFEFYNNTFINHIDYKFDNSNLSFILQYASIEMNTCFQNNIMNHFKDYLNRYINILFLDPYKDDISKIKDKNIRNEKYRTIKNDLRLLKLDLYSNSKTEKYEGIHKNWLNENRNNLVPKLLNDNINYHLKDSPYDFINYSIYINKEIEKLNRRPYQIVPQRNNNVPKFITFDHAGILDIFGYELIKYINKDKLKDVINIHNIENKKKYEIKSNKAKEENKELKELKIINIDNIRKDEIMLNPKFYQKSVFDALLNFNKKVFKREKKNVFNYQFKTDGVSIILDFVNYRKDKYESNEEKKNEKLENILMYNEDNNKMKKSKKIRKVNNNNQESIFNNSDEYIELEKLNKNQIKKLNEEYIILGLDPGKKSLCSIVDENKNMFQYNACNRRHKTYAKFQHKIQKKIRKEDNITMYESFISDYSCRTLNNNEYYDYLKVKNSISEVTKDFYNKKVHRNLRFRMYCNTKKSESQLLNEIEKKFTKEGKKIAIGYGNWSMKSQMKNFFSTPNQGFRKLIHSKFLTITVDEFRTSCRYYKTGTDLENFEYIKNKKKVKCHKLLRTTINTNPTGKNNCIYIDRDRNGGKNILQCLTNKLCNKERPLFLQRNS
jgi:hypothetical protein